MEIKIKWQKAPAELIMFLDTVMESRKLERRVMFGYPVYFVNKNMFLGIFQDSLFIRLSEELLRELDPTGKIFKTFAPMAGRIMKSYYIIPKKMYDDLDPLIDKSLVYAKTLKPKDKKKSK
jgi:TfoX/Sxy family transcriptional regulator of competence genes